MKMSQAEYDSIISRRMDYRQARTITVQPIAVLPPRGDRALNQKYGNRKVKVGDETFDSKKEYARYLQLMILEQAGEISKLTRQVIFELAPAVELNGKRKRALQYRCDFTYLEMGKLVCEDVKGVITKEFRTKQHLMKHIHGIDILIT